jgi:DNA-binding beta-propeller fold protein YncE
VNLILVAAITMAAKTPHLFVANQGDKTMSVIDLQTNRQIKVIDEQQTTMHGHEVAVGRDPHIVFMPIYGNVGVGAAGLDGNEMLAIDWTTGAIKGRLDFGHGVRPHCAVYEPTRKLLYVTTELDSTVTIIDPKTLKILGAVPTGAQQSHMLAISSDGRKGYTSNVNPGSVSVLDLVNRRTVAVIPISAVSQRIAISRDDRWVFTSDQTKQRMAVIDTRTNAIARWINLPGNGYGSATTPDGHWLLVPIPSKNEVVAIDLHTFEIGHTVPVVQGPQEMLVRPDGKFAYVAGSSAKKVAVIDLSQWRQTETIDVGNFPDGLAYSEG